jgi:hypothetical protein
MRCITRSALLQVCCPGVPFTANFVGRLQAALKLAVMCPSAGLLPLPRSLLLGLLALCIHALLRVLGVRLTGAKAAVGMSCFDTQLMLKSPKKRVLECLKRHLGNECLLTLILAPASLLQLLPAR